MALSTITVTITNTNTNPLVLGNGVDTTVISPTGITTPDTPYVEYVADSKTITDGSIKIPLYNKVQYSILPASSILTIYTEDSNEAVYYSQLKVEGANISVSTDPVQAVSVTFDKTTAAISGTGTTSITATTNPAGQTVTWSSSDTSVATVSSGTVTGAGNGTATITGTITVNGATAKAECVVTVTGN